SYREDGAGEARCRDRERDEPHHEGREDDLRGRESADRPDREGDRRAEERLSGVLPAQEPPGGPRARDQRQQGSLRSAAAPLQGDASAGKAAYRGCAPRCVRASAATAVASEV